MREDGGGGAKIGRGVRQIREAATIAAAKGCVKGLKKGASLSTCMYVRAQHQFCACLTKC